MRKLVASEWVTLDGVFDADNMDLWFNPYHSDDRAEYIKQLNLTASAFLLGRKTYEMLAPYWSSLENNEMGIADKLNSAPKYVVSSTLKEARWNNTTIIKVEEIARLKQQPGQDMVIFGSAELVHVLLESDLIDELLFLVHPIMVGHGKGFFKDGVAPTRLELTRTQAFSLGVFLLCYRPAK